MNDERRLPVFGDSPLVNRVTNRPLLAATVLIAAFMAMVGYRFLDALQFLSTSELLVWKAAFLTTVLAPPILIAACAA